MATKKTLTNTDAKITKAQVSDVEFFGDGDLFQLISKVSSKKEGWMKSTKAMFTGKGCIIQVTTQQGNNVAEALTYVPNVKIVENTIFDKELKDSLIKIRTIEPMNIIDRIRSFFYF
jgi:hypothetical protein